MVSASRDLEVDAPLELSYGRLTNAELLRLYGFTLLENPDDSVSVPIPWEKWSVDDGELPNLLPSGKSAASITLMITAVRYDCGAFLLYH